jgi:hypothetical protein
MLSDNPFHSRHPADEGIVRIIRQGAGPDGESPPGNRNCSVSGLSPQKLKAFIDRIIDNFTTLYINKPAASHIHESDPRRPAGRHLDMEISLSPVTVDKRRRDGIAYRGGRQLAYSFASILHLLFLKVKLMIVADVLVAATPAKSIVQAAGFDAMLGWCDKPGQSPPGEALSDLCHLCFDNIPLHRERHE